MLLKEILLENDLKTVLVFCKTKRGANQLATFLASNKINASLIHGNKSQNAREKAFQDFRDGNVKVLIATDVSARGIDIPNVDYVVNYDLPDQAENYVHRVGRTGRADNKGFAVSFCSNEEKELLKEIEAYIGHTIEVLTIFKKDYEETIDYSNDESATNWRDLINDDDEKPNRKGKRK